MNPAALIKVQLCIPFLRSSVHIGSEIRSNGMRATAGDDSAEASTTSVIHLMALASPGTASIVGTSASSNIGAVMIEGGFLHNFAFLSQPVNLGIDKARIAPHRPLPHAHGRTARRCRLAICDDAKPARTSMQSSKYQ